MSEELKSPARIGGRPTTALAVAGRAAAPTYRIWRRQPGSPAAERLSALPLPLQTSLLRLAHTAQAAIAAGEPSVFTAVITLAHRAMSDLAPGPGGRWVASLIQPVIESAQTASAALTQSAPGAEPAGAAKSAIETLRIATEALVRALDGGELHRGALYFDAPLDTRLTTPAGVMVFQEKQSESPDASNTVSSPRTAASTPEPTPHEAVDLRLELDNLEPYVADLVQDLLTTRLPSLVSAARHQNAEARVEQLIRAIAPADPLAAVELKVAESTLALRTEFLEDVPTFTSAEVHRNAGFPGNNPSQTVHRWRKAGKIFAISHGGRDLYPAFQFGADGKPLPIIEELLAILAKDRERSDWDNAMWFAGETGWLDGDRPLDVLTSAPEAVKRAAEQEALRDAV